MQSKIVRSTLEYKKGKKFSSNVLISTSSEHVEKKLVAQKTGKVPNQSKDG
jgi:hypothetical protein